MPIIKSAIKKLRKDKKRTIHNREIRRRYKELVKEALNNPTDKNVQAAASAVDKAAKRNVIHKNKASRLKSRIMKAKKVKPKTKKKKEKKEKKKKTKTKKKTKKGKGSGKKKKKN